MAISKSKYNEMVLAYEDVQSVMHVAKTCGINKETASRYIRQGDEKRGWEAIEVRYHGVQRRAFILADRRKAEVMAETIDMASQLRLKLFGRLLEGLENPKQYVQISEFIGLSRLQKEMFGGDDPITGQKIEAITGALVIAVSSALIEHGLPSEEIPKIMDRVVEKFRERVKKL